MATERAPPLHRLPNHLPIIADAAKLALEMGNSPAMVFKHYREVVKPKVAEQYWNIRPALAANVVALTA